MVSFIGFLFLLGCVALPWCFIFDLVNLVSLLVWWPFFFVFGMVFVDWEKSQVRRHIKEYREWMQKAGENDRGS